MTDWSGKSETKEVKVGDVITVTSYLTVPSGKRVNSIDLSEEFNIGGNMLELITDIDDASAYPNMGDATVNIDGNTVMLNQTKAKYNQALTFDSEDSVLLQLQYKVIATGKSEIKVSMNRLATIASDNSYANQVTNSAIVGTDAIQSRTVFTAGGIIGDTDGDEQVTILDATAIQRHLVKLPTESFDEHNADADGDGEITILDATAIQRYLVKLPTNEKIGQMA